MKIAIEDKNELIIINKELESEKGFEVFEELTKQYEDEKELLWLNEKLDYHPIDSDRGEKIENYKRIFFNPKNKDIVCLILTENIKRYIGNEIYEGVISRNFYKKDIVYK